MALWWRHRFSGSIAERVRRRPEDAVARCPRNASAPPCLDGRFSHVRWNSAIFDGTQPCPMEGGYSLFSSHDRTSSNIIEKTKKAYITNNCRLVHAPQVYVQCYLAPPGVDSGKARARARASLGRMIDRHTYRPIDRHIHIDRSMYYAYRSIGDRINLAPHGCRARTRVS